MAGKAEVRYDAAYILPNQIANKVCDLGFEASVLEEGDGEGQLDLIVSTVCYWLVKLSRESPLSPAVLASTISKFGSHNTIKYPKPTVEQHLIATEINH